jgi:hypothetical protein
MNARPAFLKVGLFNFVLGIIAVPQWDFGKAQWNYGELRFEVWNN